MNRLVLFTCILLTSTACTKPLQKTSSDADHNFISNIRLDIDQANRLSQLPLNCIDARLPYKPGHTLTSEEDLGMPYDHHPAFYGCFDWHSAVHGHWSLVFLLKSFPDLESSQIARQKLSINLTKDNIEKELAYFYMNRYTKTFERTYGWAWFLKLQEELYTWDDPDAKEWYDNLHPLAAYFSNLYIEYLPKLVYPIRVGEHSNTAFGLSFAYDYAQTIGDQPLIDAIKKNAIRFYKNDRNCPLSWEPSGYDFLSPCLQEIDIMRKVLDKEEFNQWIKVFLPDLTNDRLTLEPGKILDRTDGKLVHLDGLNFSRAWCMYTLSQFPVAGNLADMHMSYSLDKITDGEYAGEHWLASFALYAYKTKNTFNK